MVRTLILNSQNVVSNGYNDTFKYTFPVGAVTLRGAEIALASISMYYSWFNITSATTESRYNNNIFYYTWYDADGSQTYTITIPDGFYDASSLNAYLQSQMIANGHYLVDDVGQYVYYLELVENATKYAIQLNSYAIPTELPAGWTNPANMTFPEEATTPQFIIASNNNFKDIIGFSAGTYPSTVQSTDYSVTSNITPQFSPVSSLVVLCNILDNRFSVPSSVMYAFTPSGVSFGGLIDVKPSEFAYNAIQDGTYTDFTIEILDQNLNRISIKDSQVTIMLVIKEE